MKKILLFSLLSASILSACPGEKTEKSPTPEPIQSPKATAKPAATESPEPQKQENTTPQQKIGKWQNPNPSLGTSTIVKSGNDFTLIWEIDGQGREYKLDVKQIGGETRYYDPAQEGQEYYVIKNGDLYVHDAIPPVGPPIIYKAVK